MNPPNIDIKTVSIKNISGLAEEHKYVISGVIGGLIILVGGYFIYKMLFESANISETSVNDSQALLGGVSDKFTQLLNIQASLSFKDVDIINVARVLGLHDFTEVFSSTARGRDDPFTPYVTTGPSR